MNTRLIRGVLTPYAEWTPEEIDLLVEHWPKGGMKACRPLFPHRNPGSLRGKAEGLGLKMEGRGRYTRQESTEWIDAQIRREYATGAPKLKPLAQRLQRHKGWVKWRAGVLGVRRPRDTVPHSRWSAEEDAILVAAVDDERSVTQMQRRLRAAGYLRSLESIRSRIWKQHGGFRRGHYAIGEVSEMFGVGNETVRAWIHSGKLAAQRKPGVSMAGLGVGPGNYQITPGSISRFMREHLGAWDHRKMRKEVLVDFLLGQAFPLGALDELRPARAA
jgi:hypothetical protein